VDFGMLGFYFTNCGNLRNGLGQPLAYRSHHSMIFPKDDMPQPADFGPTQHSQGNMPTVA
jgi:hypothetical protein